MGVLFERDVDPEIRRKTLQGEFDRNEKRIEELQRRNTVLQARLDELPPPPKRTRNPEEAWRDAIVEMRAFTLAELGARMGVTPQAARTHVFDWVAEGKLRNSGKRFRGAVIYEYVEPESAGAAFERQQEQRRSMPRPEEVAARDASAAPVAGTGSDGLSGLKKELRPIVQQAMLDGWRLGRQGNDHMVLRKTGHRPVAFALTPKNPGNTADQIRQKLARSDRGSLARA